MVCGLCFVKWSSTMVCVCCLRACACACAYACAYMCVCVYMMLHVTLTQCVCDAMAAVAQTVVMRDSMVQTSTHTHLRRAPPRDAPVEIDAPQHVQVCARIYIDFMCVCVCVCVYYVYTYI